MVKPMADKPLIGVSACLVGKNFRYNGEDVRNCFLSEVLSKYVNFLPVCPEVEMGLPVPREPIILVGSSDNPSLIGKLSRRNLTKEMHNWIKAKLVELKNFPLSGFIFKKSSPSCGLYRVKVWWRGSCAYLRIGTGLFAEAFRRSFPWLPLLQDDEFGCVEQFDQFMERVFTLWRLKEAFNKGHRHICDFHTRNRSLFFIRTPVLTMKLDEFLKSGKLNDYAKCVPRILAVPRNKRFVIMYLVSLLDGIGGLNNHRAIKKLKKLIRYYEEGQINVFHLRQEFSSSDEYFFNPYPLEVLSELTS